MSTTNEKHQQDAILFGTNSPYVESLYEQFLDSPDTVDATWRSYFTEIQNGNADVAHGPVIDRFRALAKQSAQAFGPHSADAGAAHKQAEVLRLINAHRVRGHFRASLDPLNLSKRPDTIDLDPGHHGLSDSDLERSFDTGSLHAPNQLPLSKILEIIRNTYCQNIGYEYMHITNNERRIWIQSQIEPLSGDFGFANKTKKGLLRSLTAAEGLERYLHTKFVGQKRFSLEGTDSLIPCLSGIIDRAGERKVKELVLGMAHRGRLNVLVNIFGKSPAELFDEFHGKHKQDDPFSSGDVKYHMGFSSNIKTDHGHIHLALGFNPSHLEIIGPVVAGSTRARQVRRNNDKSRVVPLIVHGDAAFAGQGVNLELFSMSAARGFDVGGTIHIIVNNQIGFTTSNALDTRSTFYCTEVAKMVQAPIFHVNADDPEAVLSVTRLAFDYRMKFGNDVVIDLVSYRRHGHNEADEPATTQPIMYQTIRKLPTARAKYAKHLARQSIIQIADADAMVDEYRGALDRGECIANVRTEQPSSKFVVDWHEYEGSAWTDEVDTTVKPDKISQLNLQLQTLPPNFELHARVKSLMAKRQDMADGKSPMDWGFAETMAYATLLNEGTPIRLVGQDSGRGTFSHRHAVLHNQQRKETHTPLREIAKNYGDVGTRFDVIDSLLSEEAVLAFEYGYSTAEPRELVIWEAQFGDFANGAQVVIDQFISSGETKWGRLCGLVMYLPHGFEGQGPEHSSARLERYLQLCAQYNMQVCVPSTPAQMFHLIRRQMLRKFRHPLIVLTPKSLLRHKTAVSDLAHLAEGKFQLVIDDRFCEDRNVVTRVVLCSGKVFYDLHAEREKQQLKHIAILRMEQIYPSPIHRLEELMALYPKIESLVWAQEEPRNQGAWYQIRHHLQDILPADARLYFAGRRRSASPAVGYLKVHNEEQARLVDDALSPGQGTVPIVE